LRRIRDNSPRSCRTKPRKRSQAAPAKTGRTRSPITGLTITERGPFQFQARIRRAVRAGQVKTFERVVGAEAWGVGIFDGFNRNTFVDRRQEARTTLADVLVRIPTQSGHRSDLMPAGVPKRSWPPFRNEAGQLSC
jgi:hypothetical protein